MPGIKFYFPRVPPSSSVILCSLTGTLNNVNLAVELMGRREYALEKLTRYNLDCLTVNRSRDSGSPGPTRLVLDGRVTHPAQYIYTPLKSPFILNDDRETVQGNT